MFAEEKSEEPQSQFSDLQADEGEIVKYNEWCVGAYWNQQAHLHVVDTTCTHMGRKVSWNTAERT